METDSVGTDYENLGSVVALVAIAAFTTLNHNLSRRGQEQSVSGMI